MSLFVMVDRVLIGCLWLCLLWPGKMGSQVWGL